MEVTVEELTKKLNELKVAFGVAPTITRQNIVKLIDEINPTELHILGLPAGLGNNAFSRLVMKKTINNLSDEIFDKLANNIYDKIVTTVYNLGQEGLEELILKTQRSKRLSRRQAIKQLNNLASTLLAIHSKLARAS